MGKHLSIADTALLGRVGNATPVNPVTAGLVLQLDANAIAGTPNGTAISTWADTSGNANDFTNPSGNPALYPVYRTNQQNGRPGIDFDGTDDYLRRAAVMTANTVYSIFVAFKVDSTAGTPVIFRTGEATGGAGFLFSGGGSREILHRLVAALDDAAGTTSPEYWAAVKTAVPLTKLWVNGINQALTNDGSAMNAADFGGWVGAFSDTIGLYFNGLVFEVLYYDTALSDPDRVLVEAYLAAKWGI